MNLIVVASPDPSRLSEVSLRCEALDALRGYRRWCATGVSVFIGPADAPEIGSVYDAEAPETTDHAVVLGYAVDLARGTALDAQAVLGRWATQGPEALLTLDGSFGLLVHDGASRSTWLATDCLATRSLWYTEFQGCLVIGTAPRLVAAASGAPEDIDLAYLWSFLHYRNTVGDRSPFRSVRSMEPMSTLCIVDGRVTERATYALPTDPQTTITHTGEAASALVDAISEAMARALNGASAPALLLSGGLDSRLLTALSPEGMATVTLCDAPNAETRIAQATARIARRQHHLVIRPCEWYPSIALRCSEEWSALWSWNEFHYAPFGWRMADFPWDVTTLGFGFDSLLKGLHLKLPALWGPDGHPAPVPSPPAFADLTCEAHHQLSSRWYREVLNGAAAADAEAEYREAVLAEYRATVPGAGSLVALWERLRMRSATLIPEWANLVSLRGFTSERNIMTTRLLYELHLRIDPKLRMPGTSRVVQGALALASKRLAWLPDANTWLPTTLPRSMHRSAAAVRTFLSRQRTAVRTRRRSQSYSGACAWPRVGQLLRVHEGLRALTTELIADPQAFPEAIFDRAEISRLWADHQSGVGDHTSMLTLLVTLGSFIRAPLGSIPRP